MADRVLRLDRISLDFGAAPVAPGRAQAARTSEGYLDVDAFIARDGLLTYSDGSKSWNELRPRASLERAAASWANKPVTLDHPPVMVDSTNAVQYSRGHVMGTPYVVEVDGVGYLAARLRVMDAELIAKILDGQHELSVGFMAQVEPSVGVHDGVRYDAVQELDEYSGNHVASVERGRAGPAVRVLLDSAHASAESCYSLQVKSDHEAPHVSKHTSTPRTDEVGMPTTMSMLIGPDGTEVEVPTWVAALVAEALDARKAETPAEPGPMPEMPADEAEMPGKDPAEDPTEDEDEEKKMPPTMTPDQITALVRRRGRLERLSAQAGIASAVIDAADDTALARAFVAARLPHAKARADKADAALLDALVDVAADTPVAVTANPFEIASKIDAADDDDPIVLAYAAHLSR